MVEIPSLYELACRAYSGTEIQGYQEAFEDAMTQGEKPCLILMRIRNQVQEFTYGEADEQVVLPNPFCWRIAYADETRFGMLGPLVGPNHHVSQVVVIEDRVTPSWVPWRDPPRLIAERYYKLRSWNRAPAYISSPPEYFPRCLYAHEVMNEFLKVYEPVSSEIPLEAFWFEDAQLSLELIDGVPESPSHGAIRNRFEDEYGNVYPMYGNERWYLEDPSWFQGLQEAVRENEVEQMED